MSTAMPGLAFRALAAFALVVIAGTARAAPLRWFEPCDAVAARHAPVQEFLERSLPLQVCFLLNAREMIYIDNASGTNAQGLYHVELSATAEPELLFRGAAEVRREFVGIDRKRYAIVSLGWMNGGAEESQFVLLYLLPRAGRKPFRAVRLVGEWSRPECDAANAGYCGEPRPAEYGLDLCDGRETAWRVESAAALPGIELAKGGGDDRVASLVFTVTPEAGGSAAWRFSHVASPGRAGFGLVDAPGTVRRLALPPARAKRQPCESGPTP